jgi:hypothetical protein
VAGLAQTALNGHEEIEKEGEPIISMSAIA